MSQADGGKSRVFYLQGLISEKNIEIMGKVINKKRTWEIDDKGSIITTDKTFIGKSESLREAIRRGNLAMPKTKEARLKLFSESELKEMGYDNQEEDL